MPSSRRKQPSLQAPTSARLSFCYDKRRCDGFSGIMISYLSSPLLQVYAVDEKRGLMSRLISPLPNQTDARLAGTHHISRSTIFLPDKRHGTLFSGMPSANFKIRHFLIRN
jgi:hypothetical protein